MSVRLAALELIENANEPRTMFSQHADVRTSRHVGMRTWRLYDFYLLKDAVQWVAVGGSTFPLHITGSMHCAYLTSRSLGASGFSQMIGPRLPTAPRSGRCAIVLRSFPS